MTPARLVGNTYYYNDDQSADAAVHQLMAGVSDEQLAAMSARVAPMLSRQADADRVALRREAVCARWDAGEAVAGSDPYFSGAFQ